MAEKGDFICEAVEIDGHVVGWAEVIKIKKEKVPSAGLGFICLAEEFRGKGISEELLRRVESDAQQKWGVKRITAQTSVKNKRARRFYKKNGFIEKGLVKDREEYIELEKDLE